MKLKKISQTVTLSALLIISVTSMSCNTNVKNNKTDDVLEFFTNAELQYETESQKESIITALNDILNLNLSVEDMKNKKYPNYTGEENKWDLLTLINRYFVSADQNITLGNDFYTKIKSKEVQEQIEEIIANLQNHKQTTEIKVENKISFDVGDDDLGKQHKLVIFTLVVTNLSDTLTVPVLSNDNIYKHAIFFVNNKEVTNPTTMGGLERVREKEVLLKNEGDYFSWGTSVEYLKNEYGNIFTVQWKYLDSYSNILKVNLDKKTTTLTNIHNNNTNDINVTLETNKDVFHINETIIITFTITNNSDKEYKFCYWQTPLEKKFTANYFEVIHNKVKVKYIEKMIKRKSPTQDDFIILKPKEKILQKIELNKGYNINETGEYQIKFIGRLINKLPNSEPVTISIIDK